MPGITKKVKTYLSTVGILILDLTMTAHNSVTQFKGIQVNPDQGVASPRNRFISGAKMTRATFFFFCVRSKFFLAKTLRQKKILVAQI